MADKKKGEQPADRLTPEEQALLARTIPLTPEQEQEIWDSTARSVNERGARATAGLPELPLPFEGGVSDADLEPFAPRTKCGRKEKNK